MHNWIKSMFVMLCGMMLVSGFTACGGGGDSDDDDRGGGNVVVSADPTEINGICYYLDTKAKVATVTEKPGGYSGSVVIPAKVEYGGMEYSVMSIGESSFRECESLTSITIPDGVRKIGDYAFYYCLGLTSITIPGSVTKIEDAVFSRCKGLTSVTIPNSVTSIGDFAFEDCKSLTSITIPNSVTTIGFGTFTECRGLTSITIPNSVTSIGVAAFQLCSDLTTIIIPNSVTSIGECAFSGCDLKSIIVDATNKTYDSRDNCNGIIETKSNTLIVGCKNTIIPNSVKSIGNGAFLNCHGLTSVTIPSSVTSIGEKVFSNCGYLKSIIVDSKNTTYDSPNSCNAIIETKSNTLIVGCKNTIIPNSVTSIGENAFSGCYLLTSITIPNNVTSIGENAFSGCLALTSITIPGSVTSIGHRAFDGCDKLLEVISNIKIPFGINTNTFYYKAYKNGTLYVPAGTINKYKAKEGWKEFVNIKQ